MLGTGYGNSGDALDFFAWDAAGNVHNGSAFVAWTDADFASYRIAATESGTSGRFEATLPAGTVAYDLRFRGAALADSYLVWADAAQHGLTAGQQAQLDAIEADADLVPAIKAKTDLLQPGEPVTFPNIAVGSPYVLYQGFDYLNVANSAVSTTEAGAGEWDSTLLDLDSFRFVMRSRNTDDSVDVPAVLLLDDGTGLHTLSADIENVDLPSHVGMYDGFFYATGTDTGTGSIDSDDRFPIVKLTISLQRGRYDCM